MDSSISSGEKGPKESSLSVSANGQRDVEAGEDQLHRGLRSYHLQFIAIGGTVGTGLFLGSGEALATAGPVGCLIAFIFVGSIIFSIMTSLGEMAAFIPVAGSFTVYASRFVDRSLGFAMGWIYWFSWSVTFALELVAAGVIIQYWDADLSIGIFIAIFWVVFTALNFLPIRYFGAFEMWFSSIKVVTILGFIIFGICIDAGVGKNGYLGFHAWTNPGPFAEYIVTGNTGKFVGFWSVLVTAGFSYQGAELVGIGAGEAHDPAKSVPKAIRWTFWGIFFLFIATIFFIGLLVPSDTAELLIGTTDASASPLVIAANLAGVPVLPHIINAVLLTAVLSAANSNVYSGSRILVGLATEHNAPAFLGRTNKYGTPYFAVGVTSAIGLLAFLNLSANGGNVFDWLLNITAIAGFITWACISVCHLRFMKALKARGISRRELPYTAPLQPYLTWFGLFFCILILLTNGFTVFMEWSTSDFFAAYVSLILFVVLFVGHKLIFRTKPVKVAEVDLDRDRVKH
ncbi:amino acid permease/ SLC12A domain-containing protein [Hypoxylon rubiginosum]|uniref:Amino acid permease/ SLC12A domain-containing protein n=1 Tax=Hypoxylon rubiginosum TaxID=110542 RepID=A0ACC0CVQ0_9PEZI|nr:amino acid permease/ SLC12A domain-containing protein [Hypoxylon rubiginosum]